MGQGGLFLATPVSPFHLKSSVPVSWPRLAKASGPHACLFSLLYWFTVGRAVWDFLTEENKECLCLLGGAPHLGLLCHCPVVTTPQLSPALCWAGNTYTQAPYTYAQAPYSQKVSGRILKASLSLRQAGLGVCDRCLEPQSQEAPAAKFLSPPCYT